MGMVPYQCPRNSQCCPIVFPWSASFFIFTVFILLSSNSYPLPSADDIMPTSQTSSASSPSSSSSSPKPSSFFVPHLSLYLCTHPPVTLGDFQPLSHTNPNPSPCALDPIASYAQGPPSTQIIPFHTVSPSLPCEVTSSSLLCSCFTCCVPTLMDNIAHYPFSCLSPIPGLFNPCPPPLLPHMSNQDLSL